MNDLTRIFGFIYDVDIQLWGLYYGDYSNIQIIPSAGDKQVWVYHHNAYGSTYTR